MVFWHFILIVLFLKINYALIYALLTYYVLFVRKMYEILKPLFFLVRALP